MIYFRKLPRNTLEKDYYSYNCPKGGMSNQKDEGSSSLGETHLGNPFSLVGIVLFWGTTFEVGMLGAVLGVLTWVLGLSLRWSDMAVIVMYALVVVRIK